MNCISLAALLHLVLVKKQRTYDSIFQGKNMSLRVQALILRKTSRRLHIVHLSRAHVHEEDDMFKCALSAHLNFAHMHPPYQPVSAWEGDDKG